MDALQVLDAAHPCITSTKSHHILDPYAREICQVISGHFTTRLTGPVVPAVQKAVGEVLSLCFVRTAQNQFDGQVSYHDPQSLKRTDETAEAYAQWVLHQALTGSQLNEDLGRLNTLLEGLEQGLKSYQRSGIGYRVPVPLVAAWTVLRAKLGITAPPAAVFVWPRAETVTRYIDRFAAARGLPEVSYAPGLASLMGARIPELPVTIDLFEEKLRHTVHTGTEDAIIEIWRQVRDHIGSTDRDQPMPTWLADETERARALTSMLRAIRAAKFGEEPPLDPERLERASDELLSIFPRPLPRSVLHTLVANRARVIGVAPAMESGSDVVALDRENDTEDRANERSNRAKALKLLHETWKQVNESGTVKDVKLYMLYLEGLGRLGDLATLKITWNQMVQDKECRALYMEEGAMDEGELGEASHVRLADRADDQRSSEPQFPPTRALNQMIQSAMLIPGLGPSTALELFRQASLPNSAIKCNIWTINIVLRYYARLADFTNMQSLMGTADSLGLKPDLVTYATLVQGLLRTNQLEMAKATLETMVKEGFEPNEQICTILVADLARTGTTVGLKHAEELMKEMQRRKFHVGVITWTALISGYFRGGWEEDGWDAVRRMEDSGNKLTRPGYNTLLVRAGSHVEFDRHSRPNSMRIFEKMVREGVRPTGDTYLIVLTPLVKARWWNETDKVVAVMDELRFTPEGGALKDLLKKIKFRRDYNWETPRQREKRMEKEEAKRRSRF